MTEESDSFLTLYITMADLRVKHNASDVFLGHARQLVWEDILKADKPQQDLVAGVRVQSVADDVELDDAALLLQASRLITWSVRREQVSLQHRQSINLSIQDF